MRKILIAVLIPLAAALGLWFATGTASASHATHVPAKHQTTVRAHTSTATSSTDAEQKDGTESEQKDGTETEQKDATETEGAADAAAQHAACLTAGIDDTVTPDVQYDDQTGACSLDTGADNESGDN